VSDCHLKKAGRPCSFLATSLPTIKRQFDEHESQRQAAAAQREARRPKEQLQANFGESDSAPGELGYDLPNGEPVLSLDGNDWLEDDFDA